ncbi:MAG: hypothetical protein ACPGOV_00455 [Magnetovibrionaceae bacterium]
MINFLKNQHSKPLVRRVLHLGKVAAQIGAVVTATLTLSNFILEDHRESYPAILGQIHGPALAEVETELTDSVISKLDQFESYDHFKTVLLKEIELKTLESKISSIVGFADQLAACEQKWTCLVTLDHQTKTFVHNVWFMYRPFIHEKRRIEKDDQIAASLESLANKLHT